jgi:hypothetical protein
MTARRVLLDAPVAADSDHDAVVADEGRADGDTGLLQALFGLEDGVPDVLEVKLGRVRSGRSGLDTVRRSEHGGRTAGIVQSEPSAQQP